MALEEVGQCPVCHGTKFHNTITCADHTTTGELFHVKHCQHCTLGITSPRPSEADAGRYYQSEAYISHSGKSRGVLDTIYLLIRSLTVRWKYSLIKPYLGTQGILDVGCGTGSFLRIIHQNGHPVQGVEPSDTARQNIPETIPVATSLEQLQGKTFDVITLWHVIEHVYPLEATLDKLKSMMSANGALFLAVPNHESADAKQYGQEWAAYDVPRHLWHFNRKSMAAFLQQQGLRIIAVVPMKLDAYYVSLLSERYRRSGAISIKGLIQASYAALRSNRSARKDSNYSSLIFVVQK
jgi:2-polyprenyl-3-methyl-5-hydroxy-6-metoxy-1,4-benzoquinol methylase